MEAIESSSKVRLAAKEIEGILAETKAEGLTLAEYARRRGFKVKRLYSLLGRLRKKTARAAEANITGNSTSKATFVPAVVVSSGPSRRATVGNDSGVEIAVVTGQTVRLRTGFDVSSLLRVVSALERGR